MRYFLYNYVFFAELHWTFMRMFWSVHSKAARFLCSTDMHKFLSTTASIWRRFFLLVLASNEPARLINSFVKSLPSAPHFLRIVSHINCELSKSIFKEHYIGRVVAVLHGYSDVIYMWLGCGLLSPVSEPSPRLAMNPRCGCWSPAPL